MPHLIIESSLPLSSKIAEELHKVVSQQETVSAGSVKTRLYPSLISFSGDQPGTEHTAITLKLLPGRSTKLKEKISTNLFSTAKTLIEEGSVSVEIVDLEFYKK